MNQFVLYGSPACNGHQHRRFQLLPGCEIGQKQRTNGEYYREIAVRLKSPRFCSTTMLSSKRLEQVSNLVWRNAKK